MQHSSRLEAAHPPPRKGFKKRTISGRSLSEDVQRSSLPNGATLLTKQTRISPVVAVTAFFKVGYFQESDEECGLAHLIEHLFFKGSRSWPGPEDIGRAIRGLGGQLNAATAYDHTFYFFLLPNHALEQAIHIMADAIIFPLFDEESIRKEVEVIIEESNRKRDNPPAMAAELMLQEAFRQHRIRRWRIGDDEVLRGLDRQRIIDFHSRLYCPDRLFLSIVGDIDPDETKSIAEEAFSAMRRPCRSASVGPTEPPQTELRSGHSRANIRHAYLEMAFKTPGVEHEDREALSLLAHTLSGGKWSRLHRTVKTVSGLVHTIGATAFAFDDVGFLRIAATTDPELLPTARRKLFQELERIRRYGISADEISMARNKLEANRLLQLQEVTGQASTLAYHEAYGDYRRVDQAAERLWTINVAELKRVARKYLNPDQLTVFGYLPEGADATDFEASKVRLEMEAEGKARLERPGKVNGNSKRRERRVRQARRTRKPGVVQLSLSNGIPLLVVEDSHLPILSLNVYSRAGRAMERPERAGWGRLSLRTMRNGGTRGLDPDELETIIAGHGASLSVSFGAQSSGLHLLLPSRHSGTGIQLLTETLQQPAFDPLRLERDRQSILSDIRRVYDSTSRSAMDLLRNAFFGEQHSLGAPAAGNPEVVSTLSRDDLLQWHQGFAATNRLFIVAAGDVHPDALCSRLASQLSELPAPMPPNVPASFAPPTDVSLKEESRPKQQSALAFGFAAPAPSHADYPALLLMLQILSGIGGRLRSDLRGRQSLAYSVGAFEMGLSHDNILVCHIGTEASKEATAHKGVIEVLDKLKQEGITDDEIRLAKASILGHRATGQQTMFARAQKVAWTHLMGLGLHGYKQLEKKLDELSREEITKVARTYLTLDRYAVGIARGQGKV